MRCWRPDAIWFQSCSFACLENFKQRLTEPLMRKLIRKPSEMGKQITCTTQSPLSSSFPSPPVPGLEMTRRSESSGQNKVLPNGSVFTLLLHCSTKTLPKQQEGLEHVMTALVKPLIVSLWVELELVIGDAHSAWFPSLSLESWFIPGEGGSFPPSRCIYEGFLRRIFSGW